MRVKLKPPFVLLILTLFSCSKAERQQNFTENLIGTWHSDIEVQQPSSTDSTAVHLSKYYNGRGAYGLAGVVVSQRSEYTAINVSEVLTLQQDKKYKTIWTLLFIPGYDLIGVKEEGTWDISGSNGLELIANDIWPDVWPDTVSRYPNKTNTVVNFLKDNNRRVLYVDSLSNGNLYVDTGQGVHFKFATTSLEELGINRPWK